jgi:hypothetical protein
MLSLFPGGMFVLSIEDCIQKRPEKGKSKQGVGHSFQHPRNSIVVTWVRRAERSARVKLREGQGKS